MAPPIEPPPTPWLLPDPGAADGSGRVGVGADLEPGTLLAAYRSGLFPMPPGRGAPVVWWSPDPRGILPVDGLRLTRSLRKSVARFEVRVDTAFRRVMEECGNPARPYAWITPEVVDAYTRLHEMGWAHSVETWTAGDQLVGGLYGVAIGGLFAGESMFHHATDASKVALVALVEILREHDDPDRLVDVQWLTPHLESLGAVAIPRADYLARLERALAVPLPPAFS